MSKSSSGIITKEKSPPTFFSTTVHMISEPITYSKTSSPWYIEYWIPSTYKTNSCTETFLKFPFPSSKENEKPVAIAKDEFEGIDAYKVALNLGRDGGDCDQLFPRCPSTSGQLMDVFQNLQVSPN